MTPDRPDSPLAPTRPAGSVLTPREAASAHRIGLAPPPGARRPGGAPVVDVAGPEPERRSRAVTAVGVLLGVVALAALVVVLRVVVLDGGTAPAGAGEQLVAEQEVREQVGSVVDFGQPYTYGNGLEVTVGQPAAYDPSRTATGAEEGTAVRVLVVVTNRTDAPFRPNTMQVRAVSGGVEGTSVWDPDQGVALTGPDVSIPAGATQQFALAFAVADPADVRLEIAPALYGYGEMVVERP